MTDQSHDVIDDNLARAKIITATTKSAFVAAGAGAGKTTSMAKRIVATVCHRDSEVALSSVVAVTFTERAAAELRSKILELLNQAKDGKFPVIEVDKKSGEVKNVSDLPLVNQIDGARALQALSELDSAAIGTIHAFALRTLQEYPAQSGLPLKVSMLSNDDVASEQSRIAQLAIDDAFNEPDIAPHLPALYEIGASSTRIKNLLIEIQKSWLRLPIGAIRSLMERDAATEYHALRSRMTPWYEENQAKIAAAKTENEVKFAQVVRGAIDALGDSFDPERVSAYQQAIGPMWKLPKRSNLQKSLHAEVREPLQRQFGSAPLMNIDASNALVRLLKIADEHIVTEQGRRRDLGELSFDDLIDLFRKMVSAGTSALTGDGNSEIIQELHQRFKVFIVDEFQDTDPAQVEIFEALTLDSDGLSGDRVFVAVGDYMQSIYRFRGADVATYVKVRQDFDPKFGGVHELSRNFRSNEHVLGWVNKIYSHATMQMETHSGKFQLLERVKFKGGRMSDHVFQIDDSVPAYLEPSVVASAVVDLVKRGAEIRDEDANPAESDALYWANYNDVAILIPSRSALADILDALFARGVPVQTADSKIIFERPLVKGLICAAKVVLGVGRDLDLWFALQSPLFGHSSAELLEYRKRGGRWSTYQPGATEQVRETMVYRSLAILSNLAMNTKSQRPHEALSAILRATYSIEAHSQLDRGTFEIDCVSRVLDHARNWQGSRSEGFPEYMKDLMSLISSKGSERMPGPANLSPTRVAVSEEKPEAIAGAVEISTIHGVKGLEFPIVLVAGLGHGYKSDSQTVIVYKSDSNKISLEYRVGELESANYAAASEEAKKQGRDERLRLLYVGATRARDYLVFSNATPEKPATPSWSKLTREAVESMRGEMGSYSDVGELPEALNPIHPDYPVHEDENLPGFDRDAVIARIADYKISNPSRAKAGPSEASLDQRDSVSMVDEHGPEESDESIEDETGETRDYSENSVIGTVFHRAMEHIIMNRTTFDPKNLGPHLDYAVQDARKDKRAGYRIAVESLVKQAIVSNLVKRALVAELVKTEMPVNFRDANLRPIQGTIDLLIREAGVFTIVDYKTGNMSDGQKKHYEAQMNAYRTPLRTLFPEAEIVAMLLHVTDKSASEHTFR